MAGSLSMLRKMEAAEELALEASGTKVKTFPAWIDAKT